MATFFTVLLVILGMVLIFALIAWPIGVLILGDEFGWKVRTRIANALACLVLLAAFIAIVINSGFFASDNADHCGPGTRYVSESHYNPATKTTITDWMCIA